MYKLCFRSNKQTIINIQKVANEIREVNAYLTKPKNTKSPVRHIQRNVYLKEYVQVEKYI